MRVAVGADNRGIAVRDEVIRLLQHHGHDVHYVQKPEEPAAEYPEVAVPGGPCGAGGPSGTRSPGSRTGMGTCIVANKHPGIRAAVCNDEFMAEMSRRYLHVQCLVPFGRTGGAQALGKIIEVWLTTPFEGGRHARRVREESPRWKAKSPYRRGKRAAKPEGDGNGPVRCRSCSGLFTNCKVREANRQGNGGLRTESNP